MIIYRLPLALSLLLLLLASTAEAGWYLPLAPTSTAYRLATSNLLDAAIERKSALGGAIVLTNASVTVTNIAVLTTVTNLISYCGSSPDTTSAVTTTLSTTGLFHTVRTATYVNCSGWTSENLYVAASDYLTTNEVTNTVSYMPTYNWYFDLDVEILSLFAEHTYPPTTSDPSPAVSRYIQHWYEDPDGSYGNYLLATNAAGEYPGSPPAMNLAAMFVHAGIGIVTNLTTEIYFESGGSEIEVITGGEAYFTSKPPSTSRYVLAESVYRDVQHFIIPPPYTNIIIWTSNEWVYVDRQAFSTRYYDDIYPKIEYRPGASNTQPFTAISVLITGRVLIITNQAEVYHPNYYTYKTTEVITVTSAAGVTLTNFWYDIENMIITDKPTASGDVLAITYEGNFPIYGGADFLPTRTYYNERYEALNALRVRAVTYSASSNLSTTSHGTSTNWATNKAESYDGVSPGVSYPNVYNFVGAANYGHGYRVPRHRAIQTETLSYYDILNLVTDYKADIDIYARLYAVGGDLIGTWEVIDNHGDNVALPSIPGSMMSNSTSLAYILQPNLSVSAYQQTNYLFEIGPNPVEGIGTDDWPTDPFVIATNHSHGYLLYKNIEAVFRYTNTGGFGFLK